MLTWFVGGIVQDRQLLLRFVVLMLPLVFFFNAQGEAHFARLGHFAFAWWACLLQLLVVLGLAITLTRLTASGAAAHMKRIAHKSKKTFPKPTTRQVKYDTKYRTWKHGTS